MKLLLDRTYITKYSSCTKHTLHRASVEIFGSHYAQPLARSKCHLLCNWYSYAWNAFEKSGSRSSRVDCSIILNNTDTKWYMKCFIYWTADFEIKWAMIIAVMNTIYATAYKPEKVRTSTGFEPLTSRYRCDALTNWAMKPLIQPIQTDLEY